MVIHDLDIETIPSAPLEAEPPLVVDPDAVLSLTIAPQSFEAVSRNRRKVRQARGRVQGFELAPGGLLGAGSQTTVWLYMIWHGGFPLFVLAYAWLKDVDGGPRIWRPESS